MQGFQFRHFLSIPCNVLSYKEQPVAEDIKEQLDDEHAKEQP